MQQPTMIEQPKQQMTVSSVVAVWLQNVGGGVGAAVIVGVVTNCAACRLAAGAALGRNCRRCRVRCADVLAQRR